MAKRLLRRRFVDGLLLLWRKRETTLGILNPFSRFNFNRLRLRRFRVSGFTPRLRPHRFGARGFEVGRFGTGGFGLGSLCGLLQRLNRFLEGKAMGAQKVSGGRATIADDCRQYDCTVDGAPPSACSGSRCFKNLTQVCGDSDCAGG